MLYGPRTAGVPNILISSIIGLTEDEKLESLDWKLESLYWKLESLYWKETKMSVRKAESGGRCKMPAPS